MAYLEYLAQNVSVHMVSNDLTVIRTNFIMYAFSIKC